MKLPVLTSVGILGNDYYWIDGKWSHHRCQQCHLNDGLTLCTPESPCDVGKDWLPEAWAALDKALKQKQKRKAAAAAKTAHDTMVDSIELHDPEDELQAPPVKKRDDWSSQPQQDSAKKAKTATSSQMTGLPDPVIRSLVKQSHPVCLW